MEKGEKEGQRAINRKEGKFVCEAEERFSMLHFSKRESALEKNFGLKGSVSEMYVLFNLTTLLPALGISKIERGVWFRIYRRINNLPTRGLQQVARSRYCR